MIFVPYETNLCGGTAYAHAHTHVFFPHRRTMHLDIIKVLLPTDAQENCFKRSIQSYIKTAPTCFSVITIIRECTI